ASTGKAAAVQRDTPARAALGQWTERAMFALRYLSTLGEWRYQVPWFLMVGSTGTGKTSLTASIGTGRRQDLLLKERQLQVSGTGWTFFDKGILIDPDRAPKDDAALQNLHWQAILTQLMHQRPERPADGLVLVLSARALREGGSADLEQ